MDELDDVAAVGGGGAPPFFVGGRIFLRALTGVLAYGRAALVVSLGVNVSFGYRVALRTATLSARAT